MKGAEAKSAHGFTLLELLVATTSMGIAVTGLLTCISQSMRNEARLTDYDRAVVLARQKMDELLMDRRLPRSARLEGRFEPALTGGIEAGWRATVDPFEQPERAFPGTEVLDRVAVEVWWSSGSKPRTLALEGFRTSVVGAQP